MFNEAKKVLKEKEGIEFEMPKVSSKITKHQVILKEPVSFVLISKRTLCLHINRLHINAQGYQQVHRGHCEFPMNLDLASKNQNLSQYKLQSLVEHYGNENGGHYYSFKKLYPQKERNINWVITNDSMVELLPEEQILKRNAYMLFYECI